MDKDFAFNLAADVGIDVLQLVREEVEVVFLNGLLNSRISDRLIFKGGTALRLVYNSPRFSEDLDFSITGDIDFEEFKEIVTNITESDDRYSIKDLASKYYTHLAQIRIRESWHKSIFSMKIEVSKRVTREEIVNCQNGLAKSPTTNLSLTTRVFTMERMLQDKLNAVKTRKMPRDIFDIWYICQMTKQPFTIRNFGYEKGKIRQELRKFLPMKFHPIADDLEKINAQGL